MSYKKDILSLKKKLFLYSLFSFGMYPPLWGMEEWGGYRMASYGASMNPHTGYVSSWTNFLPESINPITYFKLPDSSPGDNLESSIGTILEDEEEQEESMDLNEIIELQVEAVEGDPERQYRLGMMYYFGEKGFPQDNAAARRWWERSSLQENCEAKYMLGLMHYLGEGGLKKNEIIARYYWKEAVGQENHHERDILDAFLSPKEILDVPLSPKEKDFLRDSQERTEEEEAPSLQAKKTDEETISEISDKELKDYLEIRGRSLEPGQFVGVSARLSFPQKKNLRTKRPRTKRRRTK